MAASVATASITASQTQAQKSRQELAANMAASILTGVVNTVCTNPLDTLKTRWQASAGLQGQSLVEFSRSILAEEGLWRGFWKPGLGPVLCAGTMSVGCRYGLYPTFRDGLGGTSAWLLGHENTTEKVGPVGMFFAGLSAGMVGYFLASPFLQVKVQMQVEAGRVGPAGLYETGVCKGQPPTYRSGLHALQTLAGHGSREVVTWTSALRRLWRGSSVITVRGGVLSASQLAGYDATKTQLKKQGVLTDGPALHVASSLVAAVCATTCSMPLDVLLTFYQGALNMGGDRAQRYCSRGPLHCARVMLRENGPSIFMRGWVANFARMTPVCVGSLYLFEQMRRVVGIGYLD
eukprot:TRINITY_DN45831_c0_g1_i1.p1 TRINITY_DN45831_c0_g1~~TRINITY_DN45831_c0_g1_i1.p1  ORF type:complete len:348 (+),score=-11.83 TRINITY_DN45831_c0_g1_i1:122-1165(+)